MKAQSSAINEGQGKNQIGPHIGLLFPWTVLSFTSGIDTVHLVNETENRILGPRIPILSTCSRLIRFRIRRTT